MPELNPLLFLEGLFLYIDDELVAADPEFLSNELLLLELLVDVNRCAEELLLLDLLTYSF